VIPAGIERKHVEAALDAIDQNGIPDGRAATKFDLVRAGRRYPPKYALGLAAKFATGSELDPSQFSGGAETNDFLTSLGFEVATRKSSTISEFLELILQEYPAARNSGQFGKDHEIWSIFGDLEKACCDLKSVKAFPTIRTKWSVGQGNWAKVPWLAFLDTRETSTTQRGVYCVFLFRQDSSGVYLTLNQGVTEPLQEMGASDGRAWKGAPPTPHRCWLL